MDIKMPQMNGYEATKEILKLTPNIPITAQTAYSSTADTEKAKEVGCVAHITKPIKETSLKKIIFKYLNIK